MQIQDVGKLLKKIEEINEKADGFGNLINIFSDNLGDASKIEIYADAFNKIKDSLEEFRQINSLTEKSTVDFLETLDGMSAAEILTTTSTAGLTREQQYQLVQLHANDKQNYANVASLEALAAAETGATTAGERLTLALKGIGGSIKALFVESPVGWILAIIAVLIAVPVIISKINKKIEEQRQEIIKTGEEASETISNIKSDLESMNDTVKDSIEVYEDLRDKITDLNDAKLDLSDNEYDKFVETNNKLAEEFPYLISGVDKYGNYILDLGNTASETAARLNEIYEAQKKIAAQEIANKIPEVTNGLYESLREQRKDYESLIERQYDMVSTIQRASGWELYKPIQNNNNGTTTFDAHSHIRLSDTLLGAEAKPYADEVASILSREFNHELQAKMTEDGVWVVNLDGLTVDADSWDEAKYTIYETIGKYGDEIQAIVEQQLQESQDSMSKEYRSKLAPSILSALTIDDRYNELADNNKKIIQAMVTSLDYTQYMDEINNTYSGNVLSFLNDKFFDILYSSDNKEEIAKAYEEILSIDSEKAFKENLGQINDLINKIAEYLNMNPVEIRAILGYEDENGSNILERAKTQTTGYTNGFMGMSDRRNKEELRRVKEVNDYLDSLTEKELTLLVNSDQLSIDMTREEIENLLTELRTEAANPIEISVRSAPEVVDDFAEIGKALESLNGLYDQVVNKTESDGLATGFADPELLTSVRSAFGGIAEEDAKVALALENFEDTLIKFPNDADKAQTAIDELITSYIDQTDIIRDLTEETADWATQQLKAKGVTNAEQVVQDRLNEVVKENAKSYSLLADAIYAYNEALESGDEDKKISQLRSMTNELNNLFGDDDFQPFTTKDIENNLQTVKDFINDDKSALAELQMMAAQKYLARLNIEYDDTGAIRDELSYLLGQFDGSNIEIGTSLDTNPVIKGFIEMAKQAGLTAREIQATLAKAGVKANVKYKRYPLAMEKEVYNTAVAMGKDGAAAIRSLYAAAPEIIDEITYEPISTGTKATYGGTTKSTSSSGSPSSSSSKDNEPQTEIYDWIEVAIKRIQEAYTRLEKVSSNVYKLWQERNEAVNGQLAKTREEIELQQKAYQGYMDKANSIGLSTEYVSKIQNGAIQIEDITDDDLKEKIKGYQEWYEKAIACSDAIQDLNIQISDLYKQKFDNLRTEFESYIGAIQSQADLIDERINRTETQGYFVSKNYYQQLIEFEENELKQLSEEYDQLQRSRDEALNSGAVEKDSEAWFEMQDSIAGVAKEIESATTALIEYNNAMRDIDWEMFDYVRDRIQQVNQETEFLVDLLDNSSLFEDDGRFNSSGKAATGLHAVSYNTYMDQAVEYAKELKKIEADLAKDPNSKTLIERREELLQLQQDSIKSAQAEKEAIKDLVQEGIEIHLEGLSKLIEKYKESLSEAKSLYEYQKNISDQVGNISDLEKILAAYQGDDSEESRKIIQETQNKLTEAREELQETQWDKYISETESLLDDMYDDYETVLNARLDDIDLLISDMIDMVNTSSTEIQTAIYSAADSVGYSITSSLANVFDGSQNAVTTYDQGQPVTPTTTQNSIEEVKNSVQAMETKSAISDDGVLTAVVDKNAEYVGGLYRTILNREPDQSGLNYWTSALNDGSKTYEDVAKGFLESEEFTNRNLSNSDFVKVLYRSLFNREPDTDGFNHWTELLNNGADRNDVINSVVESLEFKNLHNYAKGIRYVSKPEMAWTNEGGKGEIIRRSDGAILTPLGSGSMVFDHEASQRLWNLAHNIYDPSSNVLPQPNYINNNSTNEVEFNFNFDGDIVANNPEEFATSLRQAIADDSKVQKAIQSITVDLALGRNSLSVNRYK